MWPSSHQVVEQLFRQGEYCSLFCSIMFLRKFVKKKERFSDLHAGMTLKCLRQKAQLWCIQLKDSHFFCYFYKLNVRAETLYLILLHSSLKICKNQICLSFNCENIIKMIWMYWFTSQWVDYVENLKNPLISL